MNHPAFLIPTMVRLVDPRRRFAISLAHFIRFLETPRFLTLPSVVVFRHGETHVSPTPFLGSILLGRFMKYKMTRRESGHFIFCGP